MDYSFKNIITKISLLMIVVSFIVMCVCACNFTTTQSNLRSMILLPITYFVCMILLAGLQNRVGMNIVHTLIISFYSVQYLFYPLFVFCSGTLNLDKYNGAVVNNISDAVLLQCMVLLFVTFYCLLSKKYTPALDRFAIENDVFLSKKSKRWIMILILASVSLLVLYPQFLLKFRLIFYSDTNSYYEYLNASQTVKGSMPVVVYQFGLWLIKITKLLVVYYLIIYFWKKSKKGNALIYVIFSTMVLVLSCIITTEDKAATVFCAIALALLMIRLYPGYRKIIIRFSGAIIALFILAIFIVLPIINSGSMDSLAYKLNAYFSGTINVAGGLMMKRENMIETFFGDIFRSIPMVNHFFKNWNMSYLTFNDALGYDTVYNSQIIPIICQGFYYFGLVGAISYPILLIMFIKNNFNKMLNSADSYEGFVYTMIFVFSFMGLFLYDAALTFSQLLNYCFPIYLVYFISRRRQGLVH